MSKQYKNNSEMLAAVHETARGLRDAGVMDEATMKTFDEMCLTPKKETRTELSAYIDKLKQILKGGSKVSPLGRAGGCCGHDLGDSDGV